MGNRKRGGKMPQARHGRKSPKSQFDKRARLTNRNDSRRRTQQACVGLVGVLGSLAVSMGHLLNRRIGFRHPIVLAGAILATGRRTAASWFRCAGVQDDWDRFYGVLKTVGKNAGTLMIPLVHAIVRKFEPKEGGCWKIAVDDSPTSRFGRHVEAANTHHNPTPGPADGPWLYGHNWVCAAFLMTHPIFGVIALPVLSMLYVRKVDVAYLNQRYGWKFCTKHQLALELVCRLIEFIRGCGSKAAILVVFDGAYAAKELVRPLIKSGAVVITRLRRDAKLFDLPVSEPGRRGRPRIYGENRLSLAKRAGRRDGWERVSYSQRGIIVEKRCKTFLATSHLSGGIIRIVILEHTHGNWAAYASTDSTLSTELILETVSDRWAIEECFHDVKEVWGAGEQQVRSVWSNIACWNICTWLYSMVEFASWDESKETLVHRDDRPWDNPNRRPSHADKRRKIIKEMLRSEFMKGLPKTQNQTKIRTQFERLINLAV
jgi:hypothetical protein